MHTHKINDDRLTIDIIKNIAESGVKIELSEEARHRIIKCREYLDAKIDKADKPIYGVTTGFGSLCNITVGKDDLSQLQYNLVVSHACGTGDEVPREIVKLMIFLKVQSLSYGNSGVQLVTVERLIEMYNNDVIPVIYQQGSLGASGDLAPLAHMCLPLLGLGEVFYKGEVRHTADIMNELGWTPITLQSKEGLALLNGTQFMSAYGVYSLIMSQKLSLAADTIAALSLDAFDGRIEPFDFDVHRVRAHQGQLETAEKISELLEGSQIISSEKKYVQDPYSFRCIPQVHGASKDTIRYVRTVIETEINSVTDNPMVFPDQDKIISAGNFHGQPLALSMDFLSIAISELASISGQRIYQMICGKRDLSHFLVANPGLNSGFMIVQYTAASIMSQNKQLCMPASVDSIESSEGQEDHVSMGANAATKLYRVVHNTERVLGMELFTAAPALDFCRPWRSSDKLEAMVEKYRKIVPFVDNDTVMYPLIDASIKFVHNEF